MARGASPHPPRISGHHRTHIFQSTEAADELSSWTTFVPDFLLDRSRRASRHVVRASAGRIRARVDQGLFALRRGAAKAGHGGKDTIACIAVGDASIAVTSGVPRNNFRIDTVGKEVAALSAPPSYLSRYRAGRPWQGFPQFPQATCQSRGGASAARCRDFVIPAICASEMPMPGGLAWPARERELRKHGSGRTGILSHRP